MPSVIALDAMGSERAPKPEIEGAIQAARQYGVRVLLIGPEATVKAELDRHRAALRLPIEIVHASEYITMDDKVEAVRAKRDSSMRVGLRMVREGQAAGFVTAGNTGAAMATAKVVLGTVAGVDRPALAAVFPTAPGPAAMLLDVGANVDCEPHNLEQFAVMGDIYFRAMFGDMFGKRSGTPGPRVGLLSIGEEEAKGNQLTREAFQLLKQLPLNFIGNVEGGDFMVLKPGVAICGFSGERSIEPAVKQLQGWFAAEGWEMRTYEFDSHFLHLDVQMGMIAEGLAVVCVEAVEPELVEWLRSKGIRAIAIPYGDAMQLGSNVVALGDERVLVPASSKNLIAACRAEGLTVYDPDVSMIGNGGGAVHCMCQALRRDRVGAP